MLTTISDPIELRETFARFPSGIAALAAVVDGVETVLIASSFTVGVSQDPPLVLFAVQKSSTTWPILAAAPFIGVSILGEDHAEKSRQLAGKDKSRRFEGVDVRIEPSGALLLPGSPVLLECSVESTYPAGDHDIVVLRVGAVESSADRDALIWYRSQFMRLAKEVA